MKTIGIIGAMEEEIALLKSKMEVVSAKNVMGADVYMCKMPGKSIILAKSGVGKVNASVCAQSLIDLYALDYIINTGVAGAVAKELEIGDVVISEYCVYHDFDCTLMGMSPGVIPFMTESFFKADKELVQIAKESCQILSDRGKHFYVAPVATGDQFISSEEVKTKIWENFKSYCTEMEGAAIAHTCHLNKIPYVVIRAISDKANNEAAESFAAFKEWSSKNSSDIVENMLKMM